MSCHYPPCVRIGKFARLLPSLEVVAISQAPSPDSNTDSMGPVTAMEGQNMKDTSPNCDQQVIMNHQETQTKLECVDWCDASVL